MGQAKTEGRCSPAFYQSSVAGNVSISCGQNRAELAAIAGRINALRHEESLSSQQIGKIIKLLNEVVLAKMDRIDANSADAARYSAKVLKILDEVSINPERVQALSGVLPANEASLVRPLGTLTSSLRAVVKSPPDPKLNMGPSILEKISSDNFALSLFNVLCAFSDDDIRRSNFSDYLLKFKREYSDFQENSILVEGMYQSRIISLVGRGGGDYLAYYYAYALLRSVGYSEDGVRKLNAFRGSFSISDAERVYGQIKRDGGLSDTISRLVVKAYYIKKYSEGIREKLV